MRKIDTYGRFHRHIRAWAEREVDCLLVLGRPGFGKSSTVKQVLGDRPHHLFSARQAPIEVYKALYDAPTLPVVLDDVGSLLKDPHFIDMLKNLCETEARKTLRWQTTTTKLDGRDTSFVCTSRVLILLNKVPDKNPDVQAILDRCDTIEFRPDKGEVIRRMRDVFPQDGGLVDLLAELPVLPSLRTLVKAKQWSKSRHLSLTEELFAECGVPEPVRALIGIMESHPEDDWRSLYVDATGLTDRSYRRHKVIAEEILAGRTNGHGIMDMAAA